jgi:FkbM family methyltransferase
MSKELAILRGITRCIPPFPHSTAIVNRVLKPWYLRKPRSRVIARYCGASFELDPAEAVDAAMLFYPQLYLRGERRWLRESIRPGDVFVDCGAYLGVFAILAERLGARSIAIEANPETFKKLERSIELNSSGVESVNIGVSDSRETLRFFPQRSGNAGGSSFDERQGDNMEIVCAPLFDLVGECDVLKLDVEGMEYKALSAYLRVHVPRVVILEAFGQTSALSLCEGMGYRLKGRTAENCLLVKTGREASR